MSVTRRTKIHDFLPIFIRCCVVQLPMNSWIFRQWTGTCRWSWSCCTLHFDVMEHSTAQFKGNIIILRVKYHNTNTNCTREQHSAVHRKFSFKFGNKPTQTFRQTTEIHEEKMCSRHWPDQVLLVICVQCAWSTILADRMTHEFRFVSTASHLFCHASHLIV